MVSNIYLIDHPEEISLVSSLGSDSVEQTKPQKAFSITYYRAKFIVIYICEGELCMYGVYRVGV